MIVLDTHTLVWWASDIREQLSTEVTALIDTALQQNNVLISSISAWELALLVQRGRVMLSINVQEWLSIVSQIDGLRFIPVDNDIAVKSTILPGDFHKDSADRIIVATARHFGATVITADEKIRAYPHCKTAW